MDIRHMIGGGIGVLVTGLLVGLTTPGAAAQTIIPSGSTGLAGTGTLAGRDILVVTVSEQATGADLNGDGDMTDQVPYVENLRTGSSALLPLAIGQVRVDERARRLVLQVFEGSQSADLNGDGDTLDLVPHVYEIASGSLINLGLSAPSMRLFDDLLVLNVSEAGEDTDLNGDFDTEDEVLHIVDLLSGGVTNLGLAPSNSIVMRRDARFLAFAVDEEDQGQTDLDGNGSTNGHVLHFLELATGDVTNGGLQVITNLALTSGQLLTTTTELIANQDLDGDGSISLNLEFYVVATRAGTSITVALAPAILTTQVHAAGRWAWLSSPTDLRRLSLETGAVFDVSVPNLILGPYPGSYLDGRFGRVSVGEAGTDLNGDGDGDDGVLHLVDVMTGQITNTGLAVGYGEQVGQRIFTSIHETLQGGIDQNLDGDILDHVPVVYDLTQGTSVIVPFAGGFVPSVGPAHVAFRVSESGQGGTDLNGDGDTDDAVLHVLDLATFSVTNLGAATDGGAIVGRRMVYSVYEPWQGGLDLNGDGDALDNVVHVVDL